MEVLNKYHWQIIGVALTTISSGFYTTSNYVIQKFSLDSTKVLLVRSLLQLIGVFITWTIKIMKKERLTGSKRPSIGQWLLLVLCGICGNCITLFYTKSLRFLPLSDATIILHSDVIFTVIFATLLKQSTLTWWKVILLAIIVLGEILVVQPEGQFQSFEYYQGLSYGLVASVAFGIGAVLISGPLQDVPVDLILGFGAIFGTVLCCFLLYDQMAGFVHESRWELVLGSTLACSAYGCAASALKCLPPTGVMSLQSLEILMAVGLESMLQQSIPSFGQVFGSFAVIAGVTLMILENDILGIEY